MPTLRYRIINVFAESALAGNPLCVFEDGSELDDATMQALALQFNLSETTFILPSSNAAATARVRIFTPAFEMPFAGHPTLGTAHVVRELMHTGNTVKLEMHAGIIPVTAQNDTWTLEAKPPVASSPQVARADFARMLGLDAPGWRMLTNMGEHAGQEVPHFHLHVFAGAPLGPMLARG